MSSWMTCRIVLTLSVAMCAVYSRCEAEGAEPREHILVFDESGDDVGFLKQGQIDAVLKLTREKHFGYVEILRPSSAVMNKHRVPLTHVRASTLKSGVGWMRKFVKPKWLPEDLDKRVFALKGLRKWYHLVKSGGVWADTTGDYLVAEYQIDDRRFFLQEGGVLHVFDGFRRGGSRGADARRGFLKALYQNVSQRAAGSRGPLFVPTEGTQERSNLTLWRRCVRRPENAQPVG